MKIFKFICLLFLGGLGRAQTPISLENAIKEALQNNLQIVIVKNEFAMASLNNSWENAGAYPTVQGNIVPSFSTTNLNQKLASGLDINRNNVQSNNFTSEVSANWNVLNGFKLYTTKAKLEELQNMGELSLVQKINTISYEVASAYTNAQRLIQQQKNLEEQISITKERIIVSQKKFDLGASGKTELLQAQIDLNSLLSSQAALSNEYKNALISLGLLLGRNPDQYPAVLDTILHANLEPLETIKKKSIEQNPDLLMAKKQMIVLGLNQKELKAERLPNLNLRTAYGYNRSQSNGGFSLFNQSYGPSASLNVVIPIYSGGRIKNILDQLDLQIKNQQLTNEQLELENRTMIDQLYNEVISAQSRIELAKSNLKLAKENLDISIGKARLQSITSLELRQAQFSLIEIQTQLLEDTYIAKTGQIKLNMLSGGSNW